MSAAQAPGAHPSAPVRVLHLAGSAESRFLADLSGVYARDCLAATADPRHYEFRCAWISPGGSWCFPPDLEPASIAAAPAHTLAEAVAVLDAMGVDVVVPQMFCRSGMTHVRALLELLGLPYLGNRPDVMALGADKARASALVAAAGVRVPDSQVVAAGEPVALPPPVVVKPVDADNSLGVTLVRAGAGSATVDAAVTAACEHSARALVESYVELGREVRCGVVESDGDLVCLPLEEYAVDPDTKPVRGYDDKLAPTDEGIGLVAKDAEHAWILPLEDPATAAVHEAARRSYRALGCRHYGLFDFRVDPAGEPVFLEAGLYCSYARTSVVAVMAAAHGTSLEVLFARGVAAALGREPAVHHDRVGARGPAARPTRTRPAAGEE